MEWVRLQRRWYLSSVQKGNLTVEKVRYPRQRERPVGRSRAPQALCFVLGIVKLCPQGREVVRRDVPRDGAAKESGDRRRSRSSSTRPRFLQVVVQVGRQRMNL